MRSLTSLNGRPALSYSFQMQFRGRISRKSRDEKGHAFLKELRRDRL
jgi:hypothetical protein